MVTVGTQFQYLTLTENDMRRIPLYLRNRPHGRLAMPSQRRFRGQEPARHSRGDTEEPTTKSADANQQVGDATSNAVRGLILCIIQVVRILGLSAGAP